MTIATGKGGRYRYYKCHAKTNRGASSCSCPNVRTEQLDHLVMSEVADRIFDQNELETLLQGVLDVSDDSRQKKLAEIDQCEERLCGARSRLANLHDGIELGTISARDPDIAVRIKERRNEIDGFNATLKTLRQQVDRGPTRITPAAVRKFGKLVREKLLHSDGPARQQIARAFIREVRVGTGVEISGDTDALAHGVAAVARSKGAVPIFDRSWCGREDSNFHGLFTHNDLNVARLPVPPRPHTQPVYGCWGFRPASVR